MNWKELLKKLKPSGSRQQFRAPKNRGRKIGAIIFWVAFLWIFAVSVTTVIKGNSTKAVNASSQNEELKENTENQAVRPEAIEFAKSFVKEYYTWQRTDEGKQKREDHLKSYLMESLDKQGGFDVKSAQWDSNYIQSVVSMVKETGKDQANIVLKVNYKLNRPNEEKNATQFLSIPITANKNAFVITGLPKVVNINEKAEIKEKEEKREEINNFDVKQDIKEFLPTFFKSYTTATPAELRYVLEDKDVKGLEGRMKLDKVVDAKVYPVKNQKEKYEVDVNVILVNSDSEAKMTMHYKLVVKKQKGQFVVTQIQNI